MIENIDATALLSVPPGSLLKIAHIKDEMSEYPLLQRLWKRVGQPRLLERGVRLIPYTVRQSGFILWPLSGSKKIKIGYTRD